jgi:hypothetical protein
LVHAAEVETSGLLHLIERGQLLLCPTPLRLSLCDCGDNRGEVAAAGEGLREPSEFGQKTRADRAEPFPVRFDLPGRPVEPSHGLLQRGRHHLGAQHIGLEGCEHGLIGVLQRHGEVIVANGPSALDVREAVIEEPTLAAVAARARGQRAAAPAARRHAGEQVLGLDPVRRLAPQPPARGSKVGITGAPKPVMGCLPEVIGYHAESGRLDPEPVLFRSPLWSLLAPGVTLLRPIPDDDPAVEVPVQHVADRGG